MTRRPPGLDFRPARRRSWIVRVGLCLFPWIVPAQSLASTPSVQDPASIQTLPAIGESVERRLKGGESHRYSVPSQLSGTYRLEVEQLGIDVAVDLLDADGQVQSSVDSPTSLWRREVSIFQAPETHGIQIRTFSPSDAPGRYRLHLAKPTTNEIENLDRRITEAGNLYAEGRSRWGRAVELYRSASDGYWILGLPLEAARATLASGALLRQLRQLGAAQDQLRIALSRWQHAGDVAGEAQTLMELGNAARRSGEVQGVEEIYRRALEKWRRADDAQGRARTLNYLGLMLSRLEPRRASAPYEQALDLFRQHADVSQEAVVLNNLGGLHDLLGEPKEALDNYRKALEIHRRLDDTRQQATVWHNMASTHRRSGDLQRALQQYGRSLEARRKLGDRRGEGRVLSGLGLTYLRLGELDRARTHHQQALIARRDSRDRRGEAITLHNLGLVEARAERWQNGLDYFRQALDLRRSLGDSIGEASSLFELGRAHAELGEVETAYRHLRAASEISAKHENPWRQAVALGALGQVYTTFGRPRDALEPLQKALAHFRSIGDPVEESETLFALARAQRRLGSTAQLHQARRYVEEALELLEPIRSAVDNLGLRATFLTGHDDAFDFAVDLLMELHGREPAAPWAAKAFEINEKARARSLLDLLEELGAGLRQGRDAELTARQGELLDRLSSKVERRRRLLGRSGASAETRRLAAEAEEVSAELEAVEDTIRRRSPAWGSLAPSTPSTLVEVQALLDPQTLWLQYGLGETRSFLWVVSHNGLDGFELPARSELEAKSKEVVEAFRTYDPRDRQSSQAAAEELSHALLGPLTDQLEGQRLVLAADGALHHLPFAALPHPKAPGEPLLVRHEVVYMPSASVLALQRRTVRQARPTKTLAVLADPVFSAGDTRFSADPEPNRSTTTWIAQDTRHRDARSGSLTLERLPWSRWEAEALAAHAGSDKTWVALDFEADLSAVRSGRLADYRYVHFATHGTVESEHPELSALVFSLFDAEGRPRDGFLRLPEIYNLRLNAELVVLNGCETALGRQLRAEGLVGLTHGFFAAGAQRLLASLWRIQDRPAAELMDRFYRRLLASPEPATPATALRRAQLELRGDHRYADPYHWAAFAHFGDWR